MYSELLDKTKYSSIQTVEYVLENLCDDTVIELKKIFGNDYIKQTFETIKNSEIFVIVLKHNPEPVGLYGLIEQSNNSAGIFFLTTKNLHKGNIITLLKRAKKQIEEWSKKYSLIMDNCYKENKTIQKWLKLLGFKPSTHQDDDFQIYYIGDINGYN
ncbi:MAG: hypothetical protein SPL73_05690 [Cyanobacteriota bacterium]|nr:hypothetical protein [Cyanobacteriota bacterium]MDY6364364.1 hypothetical protein [Cyanobacteriota bacterium]